MSEEIEHDDAEEGDIRIMPCFDDTMCERRVFLDEIVADDVVILI